MENTPLKTNRMPYFNRYQAMGRQVSNITQTLHQLIWFVCFYFSLLNLPLGSRRVTTPEERIR